MFLRLQRDFLYHPYYPLYVLEILLQPINLVMIMWWWWHREPSVCLTLKYWMISFVCLKAVLSYAHIYSIWYVDEFLLWCFAIENTTNTKKQENISILLLKIYLGLSIFGVFSKHISTRKYFLIDHMYIEQTNMDETLLNLFILSRSISLPFMKPTKISRNEVCLSSW